MSNQYDAQPPVAQGSSSNTDVVTALQGIIRQITAGNAALVAVIKSDFPRITPGSAMLGASATTVVAAAQVTAASRITLTPTNAAAATLVGSAKSPYISARSAGVSFTIATASGAAAVGTETFDYLIVG